MIKIRKMKRAVHYDFHTMPGIYYIACDCDAEDFAKTLKNAHVDVINATAQCNIGHAYFPTKIGVMYPGLKVDLFGDIVKACKKEGIGVVGYVSTALNHEACLRHTDWCRINKNGEMVSGDRTANFFRSLCFNTEYTDHILGIIQEVLDYGVDGIFLDNVIYPACYCPTCTKMMKEQGIDLEDDDAVKLFAYNSAIEFAKKVRALVPEDKSVITNGLGGTIARTHGEIECLPGGGWGYDYFPTAAAYSRNVYDEHMIYMTGRFQRSWADFGGYRNRASIENDFYDALGAGAQVSVGDHLDPKGRLYKPLYDMIGEIYEKIEKYEKWTDDAKYIKEVAILKNTDPMFPFEDKLAWDAAARMCGELKYNFDVIDESMDFEPYKVIIIPDLIRMTKTLKEKIEKYLEDGTKAVLASGTSILDRNDNYIESKCWDFVGYEGINEAEQGYYKLNDDDCNLSVYQSGVYVKPDEKYRLAKFVKPYFVRHWDGLHGYFYTPPEKETEYAAIAEKDNFRFVSFRLFIAYYKYAYTKHRDIVADFLNKFIKEPLIKAESMPKTSRLSLTGTDDYKLLHVKVTYPEVKGWTTIIEEHNELEAGKKVMIKGEFKKVVVLPDETPLESEIKNGYTEITLPKIVGYEMIKAE